MPIILSGIKLMGRLNSLPSPDEPVGPTDPGPNPLPDQSFYDQYWILQQVGETRGADNNHIWHFNGFSMIAITLTGDAITATVSNTIPSLTGPGESVAGFFEPAGSPISAGFSDYYGGYLFVDFGQPVWVTTTTYANVDPLSAPLTVTLSTMSGGFTPRVIHTDANDTSLQKLYSAVL